MPQSQVSFGVRPLHNSPHFDLCHTIRHRSLIPRFVHASSVSVGRWAGFSPRTPQSHPPRRAAVVARLASAPGSTQNAATGTGTKATTRTCAGRACPGSTSTHRGAFSFRRRKRSTSGIRKRFGAWGIGGKSSSGMPCGSSLTIRCT